MMVCLREGASCEKSKINWERVPKIREGVKEGMILSFVVSGGSTSQRRSEETLLTLSLMFM